ncbi:hypothetical protein THMIRHAS_02290 [Thiosulfatimonas sediminis]|uniref:Uncharacterized protein n=1 Tax=Thiosulfatimonas sediminis TaxID=2675054 RepID=A0A6F8PRZ6_9GAMM|nr:hypothetical protein [Thiosulfatimonas sediminis]BBP44856.1 hypothetical protein THMIRHAS_02290 [Thiosulfatimonas sediminis]
MEKVTNYRPKFDAQTVMQDAVKRDLQRKKAMGQYAVVFENGEIKTLNFSAKVVVPRLFSTTSS